EEVVGGEEAGDDRGGAGAEPPRQRDLAAQPEGDAIGWMQGLESAHDQVVAPGRDPQPTGVGRELARPLDLQLEEERDGSRKHVVARPQIGRGSGNADQPPPRRHAKTARSTALRSFSQLITAGAFESAVSGSLRPWPVRTQTTDSGGAAPSTVGKPWARSP